MVERWAMIVGGEVINIIRWDGNPDTWTPSSNMTMVNLSDGLWADVGWMWDGEEFHAPEVPEEPE